MKLGMSGLVNYPMREHT